MFNEKEKQIVSKMTMVIDKLTDGVPILIVVYALLVVLKRTLSQISETKTQHSLIAAINRSLTESVSTSGLREK